VSAELAQPPRAAPMTIMRQGCLRAFGLDTGRLKDASSDEHCAGPSAISPSSDIAISGPTASTCRPAWRMIQCLLAILDAIPRARRSSSASIDGVRESAQSWRDLLLDLKRRGLAMAPELVVADGALGFWQAIEEVWADDPPPALRKTAIKHFSPRRTRIGDRSLLTGVPGQLAVTGSERLSLHACLLWIQYLRSSAK
jgi:Transposase, Mutator family